MPAILQKMFDNANLKYTVSQSTFAGQSLQGHLNDMIDSVSNDVIWTHSKTIGDTTETEKALYSKKWDYVVLQEGTVRLLIPEVKIRNVIPSIQAIKDKIKGGKTEFILFKTWASLDSFPKQYCYPSRVVNKSIKKEKCCSPIMQSFEEETTLINSSYDTVAAVTGMTTLPIANCFAEIVKGHPNINLYDDESHPSKLGSYLNACVFFKYFAKQKASTIKYYADIDKSIAVTIQSVVDKNYP
ncbi:MAG: DUF4886 domain-containing protein [Bacteroidia bacterium]